MFESTLVKIPHCWKSHDVALIRVLMQENLIFLYANNKAADQPAHPRSQISTFVIHSLSSVYVLFMEIFFLSRDTRFSTMWYFNKCRLRRACVASF